MPLLCETLLNLYVSFYRYPFFLAEIIKKSANDKKKQKKNDVRAENSI